MTRKKTTTKPKLQKWEAELRQWLLAQGSQYEDGELQVLPEIKRIYATRNPYSVRALITQGYFGDHGRALLSLIPEPGQPVDDMEFRMLHGDGKWAALFAVAKSGIQKIAMLAFQRSGTVGAAAKAEMWRCLSIGEALCRELLEQEIRCAREERGMR